MKLQIRTATEKDAKELLEIYRPYVEETAISFEYETPSLEEFQGRIKDTLKKYPYLVGIVNDEIIGYVYAGAFKGREAYDWSVETTIYMKKNCRGAGYGRMLYEALEEELRKQHILNANACIAYTKEENPYLTNDSMKFHEKLGYTLVGTFHESGYKFHQWYDMIWMEKMLGTHQASPQGVIPYSKLIS